MSEFTAPEGSHPVLFGEALVSELEAIIELLTDDVLGATREGADFDHYAQAFAEIDVDPNQVLVVGRQAGGVVATLQLTVIPGLTHGGTKRGQIEAVRVDRSLRGQGIGERMCEWAVEQAVERGCRMIQLTTDGQRTSALRFYERLGFVHTHHGLKLWIPDQIN